MSGTPIRPGAFFFLVTVALVGAGAATALVLAGEPLVAGAALALAVGFLTVARTRAPRSRRLVLVEATAERVVEAALLGAIAWTAVPEQPVLVAATIAALGASYLAAYLHVRAVGLGFRLGEAVWLRGTAMLAVAAGLVLGWVQVGLWTVVVLSAIVLVRETTAVARQKVAG
jgi:hypothetical protein